LISKKIAIGQVHEASESDSVELGYLMYTAGVVAKKLNLEDGYRLVVNQGLNAQQSVNYLHIHLLSGRKFTWPPG
jgi:histidine triad (HIT) family protein